MPLLRYFLFTGSVLMALLFAFDAWAPLPSIAHSTPAASDYLPVLRIHSERKWPEPIVFDTSAPAMAAAVIPVEANTVAPISPPAAERVRETFAQFEPANPKQGQVRSQPKRKIAKSRAAPSIAVGQQPRFGFLASSW